MSCEFCQQKYDGSKLSDNINRGTNEFYLTLAINHLRLWKNYSYCGCYKIKYCPVCGRSLNNFEEICDTQSRKVDI